MTGSLFAAVVLLVLQTSPVSYGDFGLPPSTGVRTMIIVNRAAFPVDVWLDGSFQGHSPARTSSFVPKEGFVTLDSGLRADGTSQHTDSYGGWLATGTIKVFLFAVLADGTPKYWTGTVDGSRGPECFIYFDGPEPADLSARSETAIKLLPNAVHPAPATKGIRIDGTVTASEAGLAALGSLRQMVAPSQTTPPPVDSLAALVGPVGNAAAAGSPAVKLPVSGDLQFAQPTFLVVTKPSERNTTTTQESERIRFTLSADKNREPVLTANVQKIAVMSNQRDFSADVPLKVGVNTISIRVPCPKRGMVEETLSIERKVPADFQAVRGEPNKWISSGGFGTTEIVITPTPDPSKHLALSFDFFSVPDRVKVYYRENGGKTVVYDSGTRSGEKNHLTLPAHGSKEIQISVEGSQPGTAWKVILEAN